MSVATQTAVNRIKKVLKLVKLYTNKPFDLQNDEKIILDPDKRDFLITEKALSEYWRKLLKYNTLNRYVNYVISKKVKKRGLIDKSIEKKAREEVRKSYIYRLNRMLKTFSKDGLFLFLNSLTQVFDPHTSYFPPKQLQDFAIEMTGKLEGIGALLGESQGFIKVVRIIPGGPSWKQKKLMAGDIILSVAQKNQEAVDITGMRITDAVKLIRGKKGTLVTLSVKKPDGRIFSIPIVRDVVTVEETFAKSVIISESESGRKFGYILLPGFYNDFRNKDGRKSSEDVKREIIKLKKSNISGLILDLRNNSGGALRDAVKLAGLFIKEGPIVQTKSKYAGKRVLNDPDKNILFSKPLIVLVNTLSASASEIVAAALQDYKRAVIVGGKHSFGKGTVQMMIDLNRFVKDRKIRSTPLGALKITIQKFYRITGESNQYTGVVPDIILPARIDHLEIGEKYYDHPLKPDRISPIKFMKWGSIADLNELRKRSMSRVKTDPSFKIIGQYISKIKERDKDDTISLNFKTALLKREKLNKEMEKINKKMNVLLNYNLVSTISGEIFKSEKLKKITIANEKEWFKRIEQDPYIKESLSIMKDILKTGKVRLSKK